MQGEATLETLKGPVEPFAHWAAKFVSHQPIPLDGTCNGLQHLSLIIHAHVEYICRSAK